MSPRVLRILAPALSVVVALFGLYQLFIGGAALRQHNWPIATLYLLLGLGGLILAQTLWRIGRRLDR